MVSAQSLRRGVNDMRFGGLTACTLIDYPGRTAATVFTIGCNFRCPYCHNPELVNETVEDIIEEAALLSFLESRQGLIEGVVVTGGEPTMHGDALLEFMRKVKGLGFLIKLDTNGTNPKLVERALQNKLVDYLAMDIKAPLDRYHEVAGRPVDCASIRKSIALLKEGRVSYEFRTTVIKSLISPDDVRTISKAIAGASHYYLQQFVPTSILNPQFLRKTTYSDEELHALAALATPFVDHCAVRT